MPVTVVRATLERVPALAEMLGRAFAGDPMFVWPLGGTNVRAHAAAFFRWFDDRLSALGWLWATQDDSGAAAWIPPGSHLAMMDIDRDLRPRIAGR